VLEVLPDALVRVQFWSVGRQLLQVGRGRAALRRTAISSSKLSVL
jgi:hypothetical protein